MGTLLAATYTKAKMECVFLLERAPFTASFGAPEPPLALAALALEWPLLFGSLVSHKRVA